MRLTLTCANPILPGYLQTTANNLNTGSPIENILLPLICQRMAGV